MFHAVYFTTFCIFFLDCFSEVIYGDVTRQAIYLAEIETPEVNRVGKLFFDAVNRCLEGAGRMMRGGSIVDATLISAPSSTKNAEKKRDPEMHSVKKGNQWHFGITPELEHRKSGYVERKRRPYQGNVVRIA